MGGALDWFPEARDIVFVLSRLGECIMHVSMIYTFLVCLTTLLDEIMVRIVGWLHQDLIWGVGWRDYQVKQYNIHSFQWGCT